MNWKRGLFRIWLVGAGLWVAAWIWIEYQREESMPGLPPGAVLDYGFHHLNFWLGIAFGPPAIVGIFLALAIWALSGFVRART